MRPREILLLLIAGTTGLSSTLRAQFYMEPKPGVAQGGQTIQGVRTSTASTGPSSAPVAASTAVQTQTSAAAENMESEEQRERFEGFAVLLAGDDYRAQDAIRAGKNPATERVDFAKVINIPENEIQIVRIILEDALTRGKECSRRILQIRRERHLSPTPENKKALDSAQAERSDIYVQAIAKIKQQIGEESFNKIDAYLIKMDTPSLPETKPTEAHQ